MWRWWQSLSLLLVVAHCSGQNDKSAQGRSVERDRLTELLEEVRDLKRLQKTAEERNANRSALVMEKIEDMDRRLGAMRGNDTREYFQSLKAIFGYWSTAFFPKKEQGVNIALGKPTKQDSVIARGVSSRAVDGRRSGNYHANSCTHTSNKGSHYWYVDLKGIFSVGTVRITNRQDCCSERLKNLEIYLSNSPVTTKPKTTAERCEVFVGPPNSGQTTVDISCVGKSGRYLSILQQSGILTLCEVEVFEVDWVRAPTCPITSCFSKFRISESTANSIQVLRSVSGVTSVEGCAIICLQEVKCHGTLFKENQKVCNLLTDQHSHVEPTGRIVVVWAKSSSNLGKCPSRYNSISWYSSKYFFRKEKSNWKYAKSYCAQNGGKLAELTSKAEILKFHRQKIPTGMKHWLVGGMQVLGSTEPSGGWKWFVSNITIPSDGFVWKSTQPDNYKAKYVKGENVMNAQKIGGKVYFNDLNDNHKVNGFLCECIDFQERPFGSF